MHFKGLLLYLAFTIIGFSASGQVGFQSGNQFNSVPIAGQVQITCNDSSGTIVRTYSCYDLLLEPTETDFFKGATGNGASDVRLLARRSDGGTRERIVGYDPNLGRTVNRVNLWVRTLTQTPLLDEGTNTIDVTYFKSGRPLAQDRFVANVRRMSTRTCSGIPHYFGQNANECDNQFLVCSRMFRDQNFCR